MACPCKDKVEKIRKIETIINKNDNIDNYYDGITPKKNEPLLNKLFKFILALILTILVLVLIIPTIIFIIIWNVFFKKKMMIKLPIYWFKRYKHLVKNVE